MSWPGLCESLCFISFSRGGAAGWSRPLPAHSAVWADQDSICNYPT